MKKLLILIALMFTMLATSHGQANLVVKESQSYAAFNIASMSPAFVTQSDSLSYNEFAMILEEKKQLQFYTLSVGVEGTSTETSDTTSALMRSILYAGYGNVMKVALDTVDWAMTTADTTFQFQDVSTGTDADYLFLRNKVMEDSTSITVKLVELKVTNKN